MRIILSLIKINPIGYSFLRTNINHNCPHKIRNTTKIIIINNLIILNLTLKFYLNMNTLMFFILINIHIYRYFSIYYQLIALLIISN